MREIYSTLAQIEISEEELKEIENLEVEVTDLEKVGVKAALRKRINKKKQLRGKMIAAILGGSLLVGTFGIGIVTPSYAAEIPIIGDIFRFLDKGRTGVYELYKENANEIHVTKEDKGVAVTIREALYDGRTIYYTYEIKADRDLGEHLDVGVGPTFSIKGYKRGMTGGSTVKKVGENTYVGQENYSLHETYEEVQCKWTIKELVMRKGEKEESIKGNWQFDFKLKAVEGERQELTQSVERENFKVKLEALYQTPISFRIEYRQEVPEAYRTEWDDVTTSIQVKDNLGNHYVGEANGGHGNQHTGIMYFSNTFGKLQEGANELIVTPTIYCGTYQGGVALGPGGEEVQLVPENVKESRKIQLEELHISLD